MPGKKKDANVLSFGQYRGYEIRDVPEDYLVWWRASSQSNIDRVDAELDRRQKDCDYKAAQASGCPVEIAGFVAELINVGYKRSAQKYHPDVGGSDDDMKSLNKSVEWLRTALGIG